MDKYAKKYTPSMSMLTGRDMDCKFSSWYNEIKDCNKGLKIPKSLVFDTPSEVIRACCMEGDPSANLAVVRQWLENEVYPELKKAGMHMPLFIKNSIFSNKFDASKSCIAFDPDIAMNVININYTAMCMICGFDGSCELVLREYIMPDRKRTASIYSGLPFRPEYRVFYDFDTCEVIFAHDYWDYDYCKPHLYDRTDMIIWEQVSPEIHAEYEKNVEHVKALVAENMKSVTGLAGPWSIDIMQDENGNFWLIDMAVAELSAYWEKRPGAEQPKHERQPDMPLPVDPVVETPVVTVIEDPVSQPDQDDLPTDPYDDYEITVIRDGGLVRVNAYDIQSNDIMQTEDGRKLTVTDIMPDPENNKFFILVGMDAIVIEVFRDAKL